MNPYEAPADDSGPAPTEWLATSDWLVRGFAAVAMISGVLFLLPVSYTHLTLPTNREV